MKTSDGGLYFGSGIDTAGLLSDSERIKRELKSIGQSAETEGSKIDNTFRNIGAAAAGIFTIQAATGFITKIAQVRGEFQQLEVAFTTILKSKEKADKLMGEAVKLAAITPFTLQDVATGAKQLLAYGFGAESITKNITMLGNVASGVSAPLGDLVYLYGTLQTQGRAYTRDILQFTSRGIPMIDELSKVMGVTKDKVQGLVEAGKVGFPEVEKAMQNMTKEGGMFFNLMEQQSKTITGKISNLSDAFSRMYNDIGKSNEGIISGALDSTIDLVNNYEEVGKSIEALIITFGAYKAALMTLNALQKANATAKYTDEAASLMQLLTAEQKAIISKKNLTAGSAEHVVAVRAEAMAEMERQTQLAVTTQKEMLASTESLAIKQKEQIAIQQNVAARRLELENSIATLTSEKQISLAKEISIASEIKSREALSLAMLKERESVAFTQLSSLEQKNASATVIAAKRAEIVAITEKITASKLEIAQQEQNIIAKRAEIVSIDSSIASKRVEKAQNALNLAVQEANTASVEKNALARTVSTERSVIDSAVRRANTIETGINTAAQEANVVGTNLLTVAKTKLAAATVRLNAFMMANPYVIVAMGIALVALAASMYLLRDKTSAAQKALEEYNEEKKNAAEAEEKHKAEIDKLIDSSTNQANADITRLQSLNSLKTAYPEIFKKYDIESLKLADILKIKKEIADIDSNKAKTENITAVDKNQKEIDTITKRIADLKNSEFVTEGTATQITSLEKRLSVLNEKSNIYKHEVDKNNAEAWVTSTLGTYTDAQVKAEIDKRKRAIQLIDNTNEKAGTNLKFRVPVVGLGTFDKNELDTQISALENEQARRKNITSDVGKDIEAVKKHINDLNALRKKATTDKDLTGAERLNKLKELDTQIAAAKADLTTLQGGKSGAKADKEAETEAEKRAKAQQDILKNDIEFQQKQKDHEFNYRQERINFLTESDQKERDQNQLNYDKKIEELKRQAQDELEILKEKAQNAYEAKGGKGISPEISKVELPPERVQAFKDMGNLYLDQMDKANDKLLQNRLDKYKDYSVKKLDIDKQYNADFQELINTNVDGKNDAAIAQLVKDWENALTELQKTLLKDMNLLDLYSGDGSELITKKIKEALPLFTDLSHATLSELQQVKSVISGIEISPELKTQLEAAGINVAKLIELLDKAKKSSTEATDERIWKVWNDSVGKVVGSLGQLGQTLSQSKGKMGQLGQIISTLAGSYQALSDNIKLASKASEDLTSEDKATMAANAISAVGNIYSMIANQVAENKKAQEDWNAKIAEGVHQARLMRIEKDAYKEANIFGVENPYARAIAGAKQYADSMAELQGMAGNLEGGQVQTGTTKKVSGANVATGAMAGAVIGSVIPIIGTVTGAIIGGLIGLAVRKTVPVFESLKQQYGEIYNKDTFELNPQILADYDKLDEATKKLVDNWEEIKDKAKAARDDMQQNFKDLAGDIGKNLSDALVNAFRNGDVFSAIGDFKKYLLATIENIIHQLVFAKTVGLALTNLGNDFNASFGLDADGNFIGGGDGNITDDIQRFFGSLPGYMSQYNAIMTGIQAGSKGTEWELYSGGSSSGQSAASTGATISSMSQDTGNALEGRFTALQMISSNIEGIFRIVQPDISVIRINSQITAESLRESRNIALESMNHLADINKNTKLLNETNETLLRIAKHTDNL